MKGVGMEPRLGIGRCVVHLRKDRLDIEQRLQHEGADIADQTEPFGALDQRTHRRKS